MQDKNAPDLRGPHRHKLLRTALFPLETRGLRKALVQTRPNISGTPPVIVLPGLWGSDKTMRKLRLFLTRSGYDAQGWGLGRNLAGHGWSGKISDLSNGWAVGERDRPNKGEATVPALCDHFGERVKHRSETLGHPIALVGWSLGGFVAREAARDYPNHVSGVITLGSPIVGGPKYSFVNGRYRRRGLDVDWISEQTIKRHEVPIQCPVISIYSKHDAIVHWSASVDRWTPNAKHYEVTCSHMAFGFHPPTLKIVKKELDKIYLH